MDAGAGIGTVRVALFHSGTVMSYQVLARKYRPRSFNDMVGQGHVLKALANALDTGRLHHAYLFTGTRGVGKTSLARILAKCFNCERGISSTPCGECGACVAIDEGRFVDLLEVDAASRAKVDETRELMDNVPYSPAIGRFKIYLIDEVHMFSGHSFNALLKTLEEPPGHVKFLLATTEPKKLPVTILSRCLQFNLKHLGSDQVESQLQRITELEGVPAAGASLRLIAAAADGSMRDALSLLDQAVGYGNGRLEENQVREMLGTIDSVELAGLLDTLVTGDPAAVLQRVGRIAEHNPDYDSILEELMGRLHDIAVAQVLPQSTEIDEQARRLAAAMPREDVQLYYQIALRGRRDLAAAPDPRAGFEMTLIRMLAFRLQLDQPAPPGPQRVSETRAGAAPVRAATAAGSALSRAPSAASADWQSMLNELSLRSGVAKELAAHCVLRERTPQKLHLVLAPAHEPLLKAGKDKLQDAIREKIGADVKLIVTVEDPDAETPAQRRDREQQEQQAAAVQAMENDPNVKAVLDAFDGKLDRNSVRSRGS